MNELEEFLKNNYPDSFIEHYVAMYSMHQIGLTNENFENQNAIYLAFEGKNAFEKLKNEVIKAKQQSDLSEFLKLAKLKGIDGINLDSLAKMFEAIEKFQI